MTREAKIGMLTGLGVIVLIGVLLSEYLGGGPHGGGAMGMGATGRMSALPMGAAYRQEIMQPVGVPSLVRTDGASVAPGAGAATPAVSAVVPAGSTGQTAFGATDVGGARLDAPVASGPAIQQAVTAVPAGTVAMDVPAQQPVIPTMQMPAGVQTVYVAGQQPVVGQVRGTMTVDGPVTPVAEAQQAPAKPAGQEYVIAAGDNLAKIAKKFYKSSKNSDIARIVAANPGMLKDEKSMLLAGKKLMIPTVVTAVAEATPTAPTMPVAAVPMPGDTGIRKPGRADAGSKAAPAKKAVAKVYVVQANDTLEKIAKKLGVTVKKIASANGIKDVKALQVGQKLQVPTA